MTSCFRRINEVGSRFHGNRHRQTDRTTTVTSRRMHRGLIIYIIMHAIHLLSGWPVGWGHGSIMGVQPSRQSVVLFNPVVTCPHTLTWPLQGKS